MSLKPEPVGNLARGSWKACLNTKPSVPLSSGIQGQLSCSVSCSVAPEPNGRRGG